MVRSLMYLVEFVANTKLNQIQLDIHYCLTVYANRENMNKSFSVFQQVHSTCNSIAYTLIIIINLCHCIESDGFSVFVESNNKLYDSIKLVHRKYDNLFVNNYFLKHKNSFDL